MSEFERSEKTKDFNTIESVFTQAVCPVPGMSGDGVAQSNGLDIKDGLSGTARMMPEVSTVSVKGGTTPSKISGS